MLYSQSPTPVSYAGYMVDVGTRDELETEEGLAHVLEHMLFKGTSKRPASRIISRMDMVGAELNAYTTKEDTTLYSTFLDKHLERALELLTDIIFHSTFPSCELEKELKVIEDEIMTYEDSPSELIYDEFERMIFSSHPLGHNILGGPKVEFSHDEVSNFYRKWYDPANMVFFYKGDVAFEKVVKLLEKYLPDFGNGNDWTHDERIRPSEYKAISKRVRKDTHQCHVMIGNRGYEARDRRSMGLSILNNMLGGPAMNSILNIRLRERLGMVYTIESTVTNYTDTSCFCIYYGCDEEDLERSLNKVYEVLQGTIDKTLSKKRLSEIKIQLAGQLGIASNNFENSILDAAKMYLHYSKTNTLEGTIAKIETFTSEELQEIASEIFKKESLSSLIYY